MLLGVMWPRIGVYSDRWLDAGTSGWRLQGHAHPLFPPPFTADRIICDAPPFAAGHVPSCGPASRPVILLYPAWGGWRIVLSPRSPRSGVYVEMTAVIF